MRAAWWWIDRWRKSTAYTDMSAEAQGVYRNLLDELWLRDGLLPESEKILSKVGGDADAWPRVRVEVMARFTKVANGWRHSTHDEVAAWPAMQAEKGRKRAASAVRERGRFTSQSPADAPAEHQPEPPAQHQPPSPSPSPSPISGSVSDKKKKISERQTAPHPDAIASGDRFARFWSAYPNKKAKGAALKAWGKLHPSEPLTDLMISALERQKSWPEWTRDGGQFVPHPSTWLNRAGWEDEPYAATMVSYENRPRPRSSLCPHTPQCERQTDCTRKTINDGRRARGVPLLEAGS